MTTSPRVATRSIRPSASIRPATAADSDPVLTGATESTVMAESGPGRRLRFEPGTAPVRTAATVADAMSAPLPTVAESTSVADAEAIMLTTGGEQLVVVDEDRRVVGLVTAAHLLRSRLSGLDRNGGITKLVGRAVFCCEADDAIAPIAVRFREASHSVAVVLCDGRAVGVLHRLDVLRWTIGNSETTAMRASA